jgi:ribosomal protein L16 Arg81 hydroxylase
MKAGDVMIIPLNLPHEFIYTEDTFDIDIFAPGRQDWIDATATYLSGNSMSAPGTSHDAFRPWARTMLAHRSASHI